MGNPGGEFTPRCHGDACVVLCCVLGVSPVPLYCTIMEYGTPPAQSVGNTRYRGAGTFLLRRGTF